MKKLLHFTTPVFLLLFSVATLRSSAQPGYDPEVTLQTFYDELEPYGQWVDDPEYGYVWVPDVEEEDFHPYSTKGHWAMTEYGNTWVSDYEWGWAPFHYGRWAFTDYYGWIWIPDTEWAPAWVSWRSNDEYYGWAPLGPGINSDQAIVPDYYAPDPWWTFVPRTYIYHDNWYDYYVPTYRNRFYVGVTIVLGNTYRYNNFNYICGPSVYDLRRSGINVNVFNFSNMNRPGRTVIRNNYINIYRPRVTGNRFDYRPGRFVNRNNFQRRNSFNGRYYSNGPRNNSPRFEGNRDRRPRDNGRFERNSRRPEMGSNRNPGNNGRVNNNPGNRNRFEGQSPRYGNRPSVGNRPGTNPDRWPNTTRPGNNRPGRMETTRPGSNRSGRMETNRPGNYNPRREVRPNNPGNGNRQFNGNRNQNPRREVSPSNPGRNNNSGGNRPGNNRGGDRNRRGG